jgi:hypothetical protein
VDDRGYIGTSNGAGEDVVLVWLWESGSWTAWPAVINLESGELRESREVNINPPYATLLSTRDKLYAADGKLVEFDINDVDVSYSEAIEDGFTAMGFAEDHEGVIWAASYPNARVLSYDPGEQAITQYGSVYDHEADTYPKSVAVDDHGWVYVALSVPATDVALVALDPSTQETTQPFSGFDLTFEGHNGFWVRQASDGKAYAWERSSGRSFELSEGEATALEETPEFFDDFDLHDRRYEIDGGDGITGYYKIEHGDLPSGRQITEFNVQRKQPNLVVRDPDTGEESRIDFDSDGGATQPMGITASPDGTLVGGTYHPFQFLQYDTANNRRRIEPDIYGQLNVAAPAEEYVYFGVYPKGALYAWDPSAAWNPPQENDQPRNLDRNPKWLVTATSPDEGGSDVRRVYSLLVHPNGKHVIMGGNSGYGTDFAGLLFWDREQESVTELPAREVIPNQGTYAMAPLPNGNFVGGTATEPPAGGVGKAETGKLYEMDPETKEVVWEEAVYDDLESDREYWDLTFHDGLVYGVTYPRGSNRLFVLDPDDHTIVHDRDLDRRTPHQQGPKVFHRTADRLFIVFADGTISEIDSETFALDDIASVPEAGQEPQGGHRSADLVRNGGVVHDGRLYFLTDSRLLSWAIQ